MDFMPEAQTLLMVVQGMLSGNVAHKNFIHVFWCNACTFQSAADGCRAQVGGADGGKYAAEAADGCANSGYYEYFFHVVVVLFWYFKAFKMAFVQSAPQKYANFPSVIPNLILQRLCSVEFCFYQKKSNHILLHISQLHKIPYGPFGVSLKFCISL
jgi:hypothetical protein